jgi:hypothetical protein
MRLIEASGSDHPELQRQTQDPLPGGVALEHGPSDAAVFDLERVAWPG